MKLNFSETKSQLDKLVREAEQVVGQYNNARWEDEVRNSYSPYIAKCREAESAVYSIKNSLDKVEQRAGGVEESSQVMQTLDSIKSRADAIIV